MIYTVVFYGVYNNKFSKGVIIILKLFFFSFFLMKIVLKHLKYILWSNKISWGVWTKTYVKVKFKEFYNENGTYISKRVK